VPSEQAEGWYRDPYLVHEDRWFSAGQPTKLVRDDGVETYDPPPDGPPKAELVEAPHSEPSDGSDLRRADDPNAGAVYDPENLRWGPGDILAMTSRPLPEPPLDESEAWREGHKPREGKP
jgi:hypothetical protein